MPSSHFLQFIGGLTFFFYGLYLMHEGLQFFAADRLKALITRATAGPVRSVLTGIVATLFLQSSTAITVMTVGLSSSGLLSLRQAMSVCLGAGVGTTFVVLLISVKGIVEYGMLLIIFGLLLRLLSRRQVLKIFGQVVFGLGFVFFGMMVIAEATIPIKTNPLIPQIFQSFSQYHVANFLVALFITAIVNSSAAVIGILISLAFAGSISFEQAIPMILGANVGTSMAAILSSFKAKVEGRRAALANILLRLGAVLLIYPFYDLFVEKFSFMVRSLFDYLNVTMNAAYEMAIFHFGFNLMVVVLFLPFMAVGEKIVCFLIPSRLEEENIFAPKYLDNHALSTPSLAFAEAIREIIRMGEIVQKMLKQIHGLFRRYDLDLVDEIKSSDHQVDVLYKAIKFYLAKLSLQSLTEEEVETGIQLITAVNELENIGDTIDRHIVRLAHKKLNKGVEFSKGGWEEISEMHEKTASMMEMALAALGAASEEVALKMKTHLDHFIDREDDFKMSHLKRLGEGLKESIETSAIHLELLAVYHQINLSLWSIVAHLIPVKPVTVVPTGGGS